MNHRRASGRTNFRNLLMPTTAPRIPSLSPFQILFGRKARLPVDLLFSKKNSAKKGSSLKNWETGMNQAYQKVHERSETRKAQDREKRNKKNILEKLAVRNRVLLRYLTERGRPGKLRAFWELVPYRVIRKVEETGLVYKIEKEDHKKTKKSFI